MKPPGGWHELVGGSSLFAQTFWKGVEFVGRKCFHLCLSFCSGKGITVKGLCSPLPQLYRAPVPAPEEGPAPPDMFKLVHYEARTIGKWVVGIRLKCLLIVVKIALNQLLNIWRNIDTNIISPENGNYWTWMNVNMRNLFTFHGVKECLFRSLTSVGKSRS